MVAKAIVTAIIVSTIAAAKAFIILVVRARTHRGYSTEEIAQWISKKRQRLRPHGWILFPKERRALYAKRPSRNHTAGYSSINRRISWTTVLRRRCWSEMPQS